MDNLINEVSFEPNYETIKSKINTNQYLSNKKRMKNKFVLVMVSMVLVIITSFPFLFKETRYIESNIKLFNTDKDFVESYEYIFVAKVLNKTKTTYDKNNEYEVPYTYYEINIIDFLKGDNLDNKEICFYGGKRNFYYESYIKENDELINENSYYLIFSNLNDNSINLYRNEQKILLNDYNEKQSFDKQLGNSKYIINRFMNVVNRVVLDNYKNETLLSKKEIASYYEFNSIILIKNIIPISTYTKGDGSDIASIFYKINTIHNFKSFNDSDALCLFGVDYWNNDSNNLTLLEENSVYFILANKKESIEKNEIKNNKRIDDNDLVIEAKYQIVKLDNYDINKSFDKQNIEIKNIINEYYE